YGQGMDAGGNNFDSEIAIDYNAARRSRAAARSALAALAGDSLSADEDLPLGLGSR
ncbi:jg23037, partial [Pararge aegeria aegeria]